MEAIVANVKSALRCACLFGSFEPTPKLRNLGSGCGLHALDRDPKDSQAGTAVMSRGSKTTDNTASVGYFFSQE